MTNLNHKHTLTIVGDDLYLTTDNGDDSWSCRSLGKVNDVRPEDVPDGAVLDAANLPDQGLVHAEALAYNAGNSLAAAGLAKVIDGRLAARPGRHKRWSDGRIQTHLEVSRRVGKEGGEA